MAGPELMGYLRVQFIALQPQTGLRRLFRRWRGIRKVFQLSPASIQSPLYLEYCTLIGRGDLNALNHRVGGPPYNRWMTEYPHYRRNYLTLPGDDISQGHAWLAFNRVAGAYQFVDLGSTNGTCLCDVATTARRGSFEIAPEDAAAFYLSNVRALAPDQPILWQPGQSLLLGRATLLSLELLNKPQLVRQDEIVKHTRVVRQGNMTDSQVLYG